MRSQVVALLLFVAPAVFAEVVTVVPSVTAIAALDETHAKKCASRGGSVDCVYADGGAVKYVYSSDATNWTTPVIIDAAGSSPAIANDGQGNLGLVYVGPTGKVLYRSSPQSGTSWSAPKELAEFAAPVPVIAGYGKRMHVAWLGGNNLQYTDFPTLTPPPTVTPETVFASIPSTKFTIGRTKPAIVVMPGKSTTQAPLVRIAWIESYTAHVEPFNKYFGVKVADRPATPQIEWPGKLVEDLFQAAPLPTGISLSAAAAGGDYFVATSAKIQTIGPVKLLTRIYYQNVHAMTPWKSADISATLSHVQVAAQMWGCSSRFRIATADLSPANLAGTGTTSLRMGSWSSGTAQISNPVVQSTTGRAPQASFWTRQKMGSNGLQVFELHAIFADGVGTSSLLRSARRTSKELPMICPQKRSN